MRASAHRAEAFEAVVPGTTTAEELGRLVTGIAYGRSWVETVSFGWQRYRFFLQRHEVVSVHRDIFGDIDEAVDLGPIDSIETTFEVQDGIVVAKTRQTFAESHRGSPGPLVREGEVEPIGTWRAVPILCGRTWRKWAEWHDIGRAQLEGETTRQPGTGIYEVRAYGF